MRIRARRQIIEKIARNEPPLTTMRCHVTRHRVNEHTGSRREHELGSLSKDSGDDAREHITHPWRGHTGVTPITDVRQIILVNNQCACTLEYDDAAIARANLNRDLQAICLNLGRTDPQQPRSLTRVSTSAQACRSRVCRNRGTCLSRTAVSMTSSAWRLASSSFSLPRAASTWRRSVTSARRAIFCRCCCSDWLAASNTAASPS